MPLLGILAKLLRLLALLADDAPLTRPAGAQHGCPDHHDRGNRNHDPDPRSHVISFFAVAARGDARSRSSVKLDEIPASCGAKLDGELAVESVGDSQERVDPRGPADALEARDR
jgi:hypothetical protein